MPYTVEVDLPNLAEGAVLHIDGLGDLKAGDGNYFTDEAADAFEVVNIRNEPAMAAEYNEDGFPLDSQGNVVADDEGNPASADDDRVAKVQVGMAQVRHSFKTLLESLEGITVHEVVESLDLEGEKGPEVLEQPVQTQKVPDVNSVGETGVTDTTVPGNTTPENAPQTLTGDEVRSRFFNRGGSDN